MPDKCQEVDLVTTCYLPKLFLFLPLVFGYLIPCLESSLSLFLLASLRALIIKKGLMFVHWYPTNKYTFYSDNYLTVSGMLWVLQFFRRLIHLFSTCLMSIYCVPGTMTRIGKNTVISSIIFGSPIKSESHCACRWAQSIINECITIIFTLILPLFFIMTQNGLVLFIPSSETLIFLWN